MGIPAGPRRRPLVVGAEPGGAGREVGVEHPGDGIPADVPGDQLAVGGLEHRGVEASRAADRAGPGELGGPHVLPERVAEQFGVPAGPQGLHRLERRGLLEDRRRPGERLVLRDLPGHLLASHPQQEPVHVAVPQERVIEPAEGIQDLQQVPAGGSRAVLVAEGERDPGGVRQRPRRVLAVRAVQPVLLLPAPGGGRGDQRHQ
jgi:hypothetical protein